MALGVGDTPIGEGSGDHVGPQRGTGGSGGSGPLGVRGPKAPGAN